jgi:prolyl-tRNA synthetase
MVARDGEGVAAAAHALGDELKALGARVRVDDAVGTPFGRRAVGWELKGVPVRMELGPRDLDDGSVAVVRRDDRSKESIALTNAAAHTMRLLDAIQETLEGEAATRQDENTVDVDTVAEAREAAGTGFARLPWAAVDEAGEAFLGEEAVTVRCLLAADGSIPTDLDSDDLIAVVGRSY